MSEMLVIKLSDIVESPVALRTVNQESEKFATMRDSMRGPNGELALLNPISVRPVKSEDGSIAYQLVDGLHRYTAVKAAGFKEIPAYVREMDDSRVLESQIIGNFQRVDTKPSEYTQQLKMYLSINPLMTVKELATKLSVSTAWIEGRLSLANIENTAVKELVDEGQIKLSNAFAISRLPPEEQASFVEAAVEDDSKTFADKVSARLKEMRDAKRKGEKAQSKEFEAVPHLRKIREVNAELESGCESGTVLCRNLETALDGFRVALEWMMHLDAESVAQQKAAWDARVAEQAERAKKRQIEIAERKKARAELAAKVAANAQAEMEGRPLPHPDVVADQSEGTDESESEG
jgi:ParB family transcriptional regulator, chromosome partitioning protein